LSAFRVLLKNASHSQAYSNYIKSKHTIEDQTHNLLKPLAMVANPGEEEKTAALAAVDVHCSHAPIGRRLVLA
jgi:hypothetical protein